jgi:hypothetical protein
VAKAGSTGMCRRRHGWLGRATLSAPLPKEIKAEGRSAPLAPTRAACCLVSASLQAIQNMLGGLKMRIVEPFRKPSIDGMQQSMPLLTAALVAT